MSAPERPARRVSERQAFWIEHIGLGLTLAYLVLSGLGMLQTWALLDSFHFNVLDYSEPGDFLLGAVRDPLVFLSLISAPAVVVGVILGLRYLRARLGDRLGALTHRPRARRWAPRLAVGAGIAVAALVLIGHSRGVAEGVREGRGKKIRLEFTDDPPGTGDGADPVAHLATTAKYVFVYHPGRHSAEAVPIESLRRIIVAQRAPLRSPHRHDPPPREPQAPANEP